MRLASLLVVVLLTSQAVADDACAVPNTSQTCGFETWKKEKHHYLTNKGKKEQGWKKKFQKILAPYDLSVDDDWNVESIRHKGKHPTSYHVFVECQLKRADAEATSADGKKDADKLKSLIDVYIKVPVKANLCMLQSAK